MPSDSGSNGEAPLEPVAHAVIMENTPTSAPLRIDPEILAKRDFGEAPMLAERVRAGKLPPVSERLPENPLVLVPVGEIGRYGGEIRRALVGEVAQTRGLTKTLNEDLMGYERPIAKSIQLNLAESYTFEDDSRTAIFKLRKGVKWSDGAPFTVDDILFWYYDVKFDEKVWGDILPRNDWAVGDIPTRMEKIDAHTLRISSPKPLGRILNNLCQDEIAWPKHIWARYHPKYNPKATYDDFNERTKEYIRTYEPGIPRLSAWVPVQWVRGQRIGYERNPYYWKIDSAGNQLPYADRLVFSIIQNPQVILLKLINGELDLFGRYFRDSLIPTLYSEGRKGTFRLHASLPQYSAGFFFNWDVDKSDLREAFRNKTVRIALSLALNREEISQVLYQGFLIPSGYSFAPSSPYFSEASSRKYSQYDPGQAKRLLDKAGYRDADGDGIRELKDGSPFEFTIDSRISQEPICELVAEQWKAIGVEINLFPALRDILGARRESRDYDATYWDIEGAEDPLSRYGLWGAMGPSDQANPFWHPKAWEEGPEWLRQCAADLNKAAHTVDPEELRRLMTEVRDLHTDNIPIIAVGLRRTLWGAHNRLGNVPGTTTASGVYRGWSRPIMHEQLYIKE